MWSETVSVINLQTIKSILKSVQKCAIFTIKIQTFSGEGARPHPVCVPSIRPHRQYLWIGHCIQTHRRCQCRLSVDEREQSFKSRSTFTGVTSIDIPSTCILLCFRICARVPTENLPEGQTSVLLPAPYRIPSTPFPPYPSILLLPFTPPLLSVVPFSLSPPLPFSCPPCRGSHPLNAAKGPGDWDSERCKFPCSWSRGAWPPIAF